MSFRAVNPGSCGLLFPMLNMQSLRAFLIALLLLFSLGCGPAPKQGVSRAARPASVRTAPAVGGVPVGQQKLMLFGGPGHRDYLGCISCSEYATDSVFNQYGTYGSRYSGTSASLLRLRNSPQAPASIVFSGMMRNTRQKGHAQEKRSS